MNPKKIKSGEDGKKKYQPAAVTVDLKDELVKALPSGYTSDSERVRYAIRRFLDMKRKGMVE